MNVEIMKSRKVQIAAAGIVILVALICLFWESEPEKPKKPELPIVITYREALLHNSIVGQFHNNSGKALGIHVTLANKTFNEKLAGPMYLPPHDMVEIGWLEGWIFLSGETITISHNDYETKTWVVP